MYLENRKALHNYFILETLEVGVKLLGSEVKSIRSGRIDMGQSFIRVLPDELILVNANIPSFQPGMKNYDPQRSRKLLAHKKEIQSLIGKTSQGGITIVPIAIYDKHNLIKLKIALVRSKRELDKRRVVKERDNLRRVQQELRGKE